MRRTVQLILLLALVVGVHGAFAQAHDGAIYGAVTSNGQPLAGVAITLAGGAAPLTATSDAQGQFRILGVAPGAYRVELAKSGYWPLTYDLAVAVGQRTIVDAPMRAAAEQVRVDAGTVTPIDRRAVTTGTNLDQAELETLPTARDTWEAARLAPGVVVDRVNIAGNESTEPAAIAGPGFGKTQLTWSIDGVNVTDSTTPGIAASFFDFDAFKEVQVSTGGSAADLGTGGAINLVTRRGTNRWLGSARVLGAGEGLQSRLDVASSTLARAGTWNLNSAQAPFAAGNRISTATDIGGEAGGPVITDRLWAWGGVSRQRIDLITLGDYEEHTRLMGVSLKVDARAGANRTLQALIIHDRRGKTGRNVGPLRQPETAWDFPVTAGIYKGELGQVIGGRHYVTASVSYIREELSSEPAGGHDVNAVQGPDGVWRGSFLYGVENRPQAAAQAETHTFFSVRGVPTELHVGGNYRFAWTEAVAGWPGPGGVIGLGPTIYTLGVPLAMATVSARNRDDRTIAALFAQTTHTLGRTTLTIGARYDDQHGHNRSSSLPGNTLLPSLLTGFEFAGADPGFHWRNVTPRVGVTYAAGDSGRTVLKGSLRRYPDELSLTDVQHTNPTRYQPGGVIGVAQSATFIWLDNGDLKFDPREAGPIVAVSGVDPVHPGFVTNTVASGFHAPMTSELIGGVDHEIAGGVVVSTDVTWRETTGVRQLDRLVYEAATGSAATARPDSRADYVQALTLSGTLPDGSSYSVPVYRLKPGLATAGATMLSNSSRAQHYVGWTGSARKRFANGWMMRSWVSVGSWTWSVPAASVSDQTPDLLGTTDDGGVVVQDTAALGGVKTSVFLNSRWSFDAAGSYRVAAGRRWSFDAAVDVYGRDGYPIPYFRTVTAAETLDGIDRQVRVSPAVASFRNDTVTNVNARLEKQVPFTHGSLSFSVDLFNLLNRSAVLQRQHELNLPTGNDVLEVVSPRVLRLGARLRFN